LERLLIAGPRILIVDAAALKTLADRRPNGAAVIALDPEAVGTIALDPGRLVLVGRQLQR
jgi:hypothetical protein